MATFLYRLGRGAFRHRGRVLTAWIVVLAALTGVLLAFGGAFANEVSVPGSESQQAEDVLGSKFPAMAGTSALIVFTAPAGSTVTTPEYRSAIAASLAAVAKAPQVAGVVSPAQSGAVSADKRTALAEVEYKVHAVDLASGTLDALDATVAPAKAAGLTVHIGGAAYQRQGFAAIALALIIGLAVGVDYALFLFSRHRAQLATGMELQESAGRAKPGSRAARRSDPEVRAAGRRWATLVTRKPAVTVLAVVVALLVVVIPAKDLRLALPDPGSAAKGSPQRVTYDVVSKAFGPGFNGPLLILVDLKNTQDAAARQQAMAYVIQDLSTLDDVAAVSTAQYSKDAQYAVVRVIPTTAPADRKTADLVDVIRGQALILHTKQSVDLRVTGATAVAIDVSDKLPAALVPFAAIVVGLCLILLLVSGMREESARTKQALPSALTGARQAFRVVTAAALIMFGVFAPSVTTEDSIIKPIAFGLAFGVLAGTFLVRMTLVPAVLALAREANWRLPGVAQDPGEAASEAPEPAIDGERPVADHNVG